jgi:O-antigen/teichoic acid export membrane protein
VLAKRLLSGAFLRVFNTGLGIVIALVMTPFIIRHLGDDSYGLWLLVASITGLFGVLDFGLSVATQRSIAQALANKDTESANVTVVTAAVTFCLVSLVIALVTAGVALAAPLIVPGPRVADFRMVVALLASSIVFLFPTYSVSGIYSANFRYDLVSQIHLVRVVARFALIYVVVSLGGRLISMAVITAVTDVSAGVAMMIVARRLAPWLELRPRFFRRARLAELANFGGAFLFVTLCDRGRNALPPFAMNATAGLAGVTLFGIAQQVYDYFVQFLTNLFGVFQPLFVRQQSLQAHGANERDFIFITQLALAVAVVMGVGVVGCAPDFIQTWLGARYASSLGPLFLLVLMGVFHSSLQSNVQVLLAYSKQRALAVLSGIELAVGAALLLPLAKGFGLQGVALAVMLPALISRAFVQPYLVRSVMPLSLWEYFGALGRNVAALALSGYAVSRLRDSVSGVSGYYKVFLIGLIAVVISVPVVYACLGRETRRRLMSVSMGFLARKRPA